jgi:hypothetical protein
MAGERQLGGPPSATQDLSRQRRQGSSLPDAVSPTSEAKQQTQTVQSVTLKMISGMGREAYASACERRDAQHAHRGPSHY